ncbi:MAG: protein translocase subunit [Chrysothrix sp. TS-e1954]|nr:MAG: protein translocase subunit [Chrysothrix sp. TS-e1954]
MSVLARHAGLARGARSAVRAPSATQYGRTPAYRRRGHLLVDRTHSPAGTVVLASRCCPSISSSQIAAYHISRTLLPRLSSSPLQTRPFHGKGHLFQQAQPQDEVRDPPREERPSQPSSSTSQASSQPGEDSADSTKSQQDTGKDSGQEEEPQSSSADQESKSDSEGKKEDSSEKKEKAAPPPHGDKSPWQVFTETLSTEFRASKEWNESTKALASSAHDFTQNETLRRARDGYRAASGTATSSTSKVLKSTAGVVGKSAAWTWDTMPVKGIRAGTNAAGRGVEKMTRPIRDTEAFKSVRDVIDDGSSSRYGGWVEKEERRRKREARELREGRPARPEKLEEDPEAGTNVTLHKDAAWRESWRSFRDTSPVMQRLFSLKSSYAESENPLISTARSISDRVAGFFAENETAHVIKKFREMDPSFQLEPFLQEMREYMLPEILDAYVKGDTETLKLWLSAAQYQVYSALMHQYTTAGLKSDGRILDIRNVDVINARMIEPGEVPVFILTCRTQEVHVYRDRKTEMLAAGMEDRVQQVTYAIGVTRVPEDVRNPETRGWRLIELQKSARDYM